MNKYKSFYAFMFVGWYWWLLGITAYSFSIHTFWPTISFWSIFGWSFFYWQFYRLIDALEELWRRTERLRNEENP